MAHEGAFSSCCLAGMIEWPWVAWRLACLRCTSIKVYNATKNGTGCLWHPEKQRALLFHLVADRRPSGKGWWQLKAYGESKTVTEVRKPATHCLPLGTKPQSNVQLYSVYQPTGWCSTLSCCQKGPACWTLQRWLESWFLTLTARVRAREAK